MRRIAIVGAGQSGLQLAIGLRKAGHEVLVVSAQSAEQIAAGRVTSSQCMFETALNHERDLGINFWDSLCPPVQGIELTIAGPDNSPLIQWSALLHQPAMSIDQRVKMPRFIEAFTSMGGAFQIKEVHLEDLERLAREFELVIVAAGKGAITNIFERDAARSQFDRPMRALGLTYVHGLKPRADFSAVCFNVVPGVGEYFVFPALTLSGPCEIMVFEGVPDGPMDCWRDVKSPSQHLQASLDVLKQFLPWEHERARSASLTDSNGILSGRFPPTVRHPIARLPSGRMVLGMADVVCLNDPITGQGSNNASKCAATYLKRILEHDGSPFDMHWMQRTFDTYWSDARWVTDWTNGMLLPPPPHVLGLLSAAASKPKVAEWFVNSFDEPKRFFPYIVDPTAAQLFIETA